ncbi:uncharacterized protein [Populus alba]|uniref:uncharacterized protein isoform X4 n=1 Tax=Populus alba TaxID=43335 RepID=UPI00158EF73D|nr:uncharacterized protein LOC118058264 isoform X3 [Populus alba]
MVATDPQRQLLTLIREFATEKSQEERRVIGLEKRIQELGCEVDVANGEMEEARISIIQDEISSVGSQVEGLKNEEGASPDEFIRQMFDLNAKIRLVSLTRTYVTLTGNLCSPCLIHNCTLL